MLEHNDSEKWVSGGMTSWPCDALVIYESDALKLYLRSIASALRVDVIDDPDLEIVIPMNKDDQLQRGCPHSWKRLSLWSVGWLICVMVVSTRHVLGRRTGHSTCRRFKSFWIWSARLHEFEETLKAVGC